MLTSRFGFGYGMGYSAYKEAKSFIELGHSVTVIHCYSNSEIIFFNDPNINLIFLPIRKIPFLGFLIYYFKLNFFIHNKININKFDVIYIQSLEFGLLNFKEIKIPVFYFSRSSMRGLRQTLKDNKIGVPLSQRIIHYVLVALEKRCMNHSKVIFVKSRNMAKEVAVFYNINSSKLVVVTGGVDQKDFKLESSESCENFKRDLKIPSNLPVLLYAGRIVPQKGLVYLVEASIKLLQKKDFVIIIAGAEVDKSYVAKVKELIKKSSCQKSFFFLGHIKQKDMSLVQNIADCLVTPSLYEPFGMVNLQAAFLGKKIVTTVKTGSAKILKGYEYIELVKAGSEIDLRRALRSIIYESAPTKVQSYDFGRYSWNNVGKQLVSYFMKATEKKS